MTLLCEVDNWNVALLEDRSHESDRIATERESAASSIGAQQLTNWPTQHMTATWGN